MSKQVQKTRQHILEVASELFYCHGINHIGVDTIATKAGVAKMTLYHHFKSKENLITDYLINQRTRMVTWLERLLETDDQSPTQQVHQLFDELARFCETTHYKGCPFVNAYIQASELSEDVQEAARLSLDRERSVLQNFARRSGIADYVGVGDSIYMLMQGAVLVAMIQKQSQPILTAKTAAAEVIQAALGSTEQHVCTPTG